MRAEVIKALESLDTRSADPTPRKCLLAMDDVVSPMQEAVRALEFIIELLDVMGASGCDGFESWEFVRSSLVPTRDRVNAAIERVVDVVDGNPTEAVLVPGVDLNALQIYRQRKLTAGNAHSASVGDVTVSAAR